MDKETLIYLLGGLTLALVLLSIYFHSTVMSWMYSALSLLLIKKKEKQILISVKEKEILLKKLTNLLSKVNNQQIGNLLKFYEGILKEYLTIACGNNLTSEFSLEELKTKLNKNNQGIVHHLHNQILHKLIRSEIKELFIEIYSQYKDLESNNYINKIDIKLLIESLRNLIIQTSEVNNKDLEKENIELKSKKNTSNIDLIKIDLINIYIALEFLEMGIAKDKYSKMMKRYELLTAVQKIKLDSHLNILNLNMCYVKSWYIL